MLVILILCRDRPDSDSIRTGEVAKALARKIGFEEDLAEDWLDTGVRRFPSPECSTYVSKKPELKSLHNLKISFPTADYLIAMKLRSLVRARFDDEGDLIDLCFFARKKALSSLEEARVIFDRFFNNEVTPLRAAEVLKEVFNENSKKI